MEINLAVCLYGMLGRSDLKDNGIPLDTNYSLKSLNENILKDIKHDIFAHTWTNENIKSTFDFLKPTKYLVENPIEFSIPNHYFLYYQALKRGIKPFVSYFKNKKLDFAKEHRNINGIYSRFHSNRETLLLMKKYAEKNNIIYTHVLVTRYDVEYLSEFDFKNLLSEYIYIGKDVKIFDNNDHYVPNRFYWENLRKGIKMKLTHSNIIDEKRAIDDMFFICSYENALKMANILEKIKFYFSTGTLANAHHVLYRHIKESIGKKKIKFYKTRMYDYDLARRLRLNEVL